jgi:CDP-diacylglycerol--glycerol-3-phosphate 3-phosphatidyltransferase
MAIRTPAVEHVVYRVIEPITRALVRWGVHPNALTTLGFLITCSAGLAFHRGHVPLGGFLVLIGGLFDIFDGRVARLSGLASAFGSFYDSTLDRISEVVVFLGILSLYNDYRLELGDVGMIYTVMLVIAGSMMVSYTRAKAETLGIDCTVGLMQRPERVLLVGFAAWLFGTAWDGLVLKVVLIAMAVLTIFPAVQRIVWVYRHTRPSSGAAEAVPTERADATTPVPVSDETP